MKIIFAYVFIGDYICKSDSGMSCSNQTNVDLINNQKQKHNESI